MMRTLVMLAIVASTTQAYGQIKLVSPEREKVLRSYLPKVDDLETAALLSDKQLVFYTDVEMPKAYQHSGGAHSPSYNISAAKPFEKFGNGNIEFPWGGPGGTHRSPNVRAFRFFKLPTVSDSSDKVWPVVWWNRNIKDGPIAWAFPVGTVFGEILMVNNPKTDQNYTFELRLRRRVVGRWEVDVFRPFPTSQALASRIERLRSNWQEISPLARLVRHLRGRRTLPSLVLRDRHPNKLAFYEQAPVDTLPDIGDDSLVAELLTSTTFTSATGETWYKDEKGLASNAPTTLSSFHVVPKNYDAGFITVDGMACMKCHDSVDKLVDDFDVARDWYGRVRGSDGIFSFHPFAASCISYNGFSRKIVLRPELEKAGMLEQFSPSRHPTNIYNQLKK